MMPRLRYLCLWAIVLAFIPAVSRAENAVIFTNASAGPGELVTIDVIIENDIPLGGLFVPFRWSTGDLEFLEIEFEESRMSGIMKTFPSQVNPVARTSGFLITRSFVPGEEGWVPVGNGPIAHLAFRVAAGAPDQVAFCDSAFEQEDGFTRPVQFSSFDANTVIFPLVIPGRITIGHSIPAGLMVAPTELFLQGQTDGDDAVTELNISSSSQTELDWLLAWQSSWLTASPSIGKTPARATIGVSLFGLDAGTYHDTILIESQNAVNAPVSVPVTLVVDTALAVPDELPFVLMQNRPNPFVTYHDTRTEINYVLEGPAHVTIDIYNGIGQRIRRLISRNYGAGPQSVWWDGRDPSGRLVPSGHYFYRMTTADGSITKRMIVIK